MNTIAEKLDLLLDTKSAIKTAIEAKGVTVGNVAFAKYSDLIKNITITSSIPDIYSTDSLCSEYDNNGHIEDIPFRSDGSLVLNKIVGYQNNTSNSSWISGAVYSSSSSLWKVRVTMEQNTTNKIRFAMLDLQLDSPYSTVHKGYLIVQQP